MHISSESLHIGNLTLDNRLILAPMAGMLRLSLRVAYRRVGAAMTCIGVVDAGAIFTERFRSSDKCAEAAGAAAIVVHGRTVS
jgi:tRNA-dihydrouridine synthase